MSLRSCPSVEGLTWRTMSPTRIQIAQVTPTLLSQRREELLHAVSLPLAVRFIHPSYMFQRVAFIPS